MAERLDAVLAHVYMFKQPQEGKPIRSSLRGHMQVSAISHLYHDGQIGKVFIPGGKVWGEQFPSLAEVMAQELQRRGVPEQDIVLQPEAKDTPKEIDLFLSRAKEEGWQNIASIANKTHLRRIRNIYSRRKEKIKSFATEDVLQAIEHKASEDSEAKHPYKNFLKRFKWSKLEILFNLREIGVWALYKLGLEKQTTKFAKSNRTQSFKVFFDS